MSTYLLCNFSPWLTDMVVLVSPWSFNDKLLLLREVTSLEQPSEVKLEIACFWVKAYDLPPKRQTIAFVVILGNN